MVEIKKAAELRKIADNINSNLEKEKLNVVEQDTVLQMVQDDRLFKRMAHRYQNTSLENIIGKIEKDIPEIGAFISRFSGRRNT